LGVEQRAAEGAASALTVLGYHYAEWLLPEFVRCDFLRRSQTKRLDFDEYVTGKRNVNV
jgi:hypothetical protein